MHAKREKSTRSIFFSELIGTAILLMVGLSVVIFMFGSGTPMSRLIPDEGIRRLITGFLFGTTGASIALSRVGKISGAHINPAVSLGFVMIGKLNKKLFLVYTSAQLIGAVIGSLPLLLWGQTGRSIAFAATLPGAGYSTLEVFLGEAAATFALISLLTLFLSYRKIRRFTPALFPPLYAIMVWAEAPISGTSTNPARSLGPAIISGQWQGWWIYWAGPVLGTFLALLVFNFLAKEITEARLYHFENEMDRLFRKAKKVK